MLTVTDREVKEQLRTGFMTALRVLRMRMSAERIGQLVGRNPMTIQRWLRGEFDIDELPLKSYRAVMGEASLLGLGERSRGGAGPVSDDDGGETERGLVPVYTGDPRQLAQSFDELGHPVGPTTDYVECPPDLLHEQWIYGVRTAPDDLSMVPFLHPGDVAIVRPSAVARSGKPVVVRLKATSEVLVRVMERQEGRITLRAINTAFGEAIYPEDAIDWMRPVAYVKVEM